jgi:hypothetical protein
VKWKNFSVEEATWEPESNLFKCQLLINSYLKKFLPQTDDKIVEEDVEEVRKSFEVKRKSRLEQLEDKK